MKRFKIIFLLLIIIYIFCNNCFNKKSNEFIFKNKYANSSGHIKNGNEFIFLTGRMHINSKGELIFETVTSKAGNKIKIIPCDYHLRDYTNSMYDIFLSLKNFDEEFWIKIEGKYLEPKKNDYITFVFYWIAILSDEDVSNEKLEMD